MISVDYKVDAKGLACPMPIVKTRKALKDIESGRVVEVEATDKGSTADLKAWSKSAGHEYIGTVEADGVLKHYVRKASEGESSEKKHPHIVSNEQLVEVMAREENVIVLDVREVSEYAFGHIPGAQSMPLNEVEQRFNQLDQASEIYVICRTGNRSDLVAQQLSAAGFEKVINVVPGMYEWKGQLKTNL